MPSVAFLLVLVLIQVGVDLTHNEMAAIVHAIDKDNSNTISVAEFRRWLSKSRCTCV